MVVFSILLMANNNVKTPCIIVVAIKIHTCKRKGFYFIELSHILVLILKESQKDGQAPRVRPTDGSDES